jgi:hypothetical protein
MLEIDPTTYAAMERDYAARARDRLIAFVEAQHPDIAVRYLNGGLDRVVDGLIAAALHFGISSEEGVFAFADLACMLGEGFPGRPEDAWAMPYLTDPALVDVAKVQACQAAIEAVDAPPAVPVNGSEPPPSPAGPVLREPIDG